MIEYVWAEDKKRQIGVDGHLPWRLPADLKHFKEKTIDHPILMGRKTFTSLPKLLPRRKHIVLTHSEELKAKWQDNDQVEILTSIEEMNKYLADHQAETICAIGGVSIFKALLDQVDVLEKTEIDGIFRADTVMPEIDYSRFKLVHKEPHDVDSKNKYPYTFLTYVRKD